MLAVGASSSVATLAAVDSGPPANPRTPNNRDYGQLEQRHTRRRIPVRVCRHHRHDRLHRPTSPTAIAGGHPCRRWTGPWTHHPAGYRGARTRTGRLGGVPRCRRTPRCCRHRLVVSTAGQTLPRSRSTHQQLHPARNSFCPGTASHDDCIDSTSPTSPPCAAS